jgi:phytoene desaturase
LRRDGFTWDTGPSLVTMPWVLEETFTAGGLDLSREITLRRLEPFYRIFWDGESEHLDFFSDPHAMKQEIAKFSSRDATAFDGFMDALRPIYTEGILAAGRPEDGVARRRAVSLAPGRPSLPASADPRGVLVSLVVHRR